MGSPFSASNQAANAAVWAKLGFTLLVGYFVMLAGLAISHAATVKAVAAVHLGQQTSVLGAYKALWGRLLSLLGTCLLILLWMALWMFLAVVVLMAIMIPISLLLRTGRTYPSGPAAAVFAALVAFAVIALVFAGFIAIYVRYALAIQACMVENLGPFASLKRSVFLSKGSRWRVVGVLHHRVRDRGPVEEGHAAA